MEDQGTATPQAPGWDADPYGRHELRYWDGAEWTDHVSDAGVTGTDAPERMSPWAAMAAVTRPHRRRRRPRPPPRAPPPSPRPRRLPRPPRRARPPHRLRRRGPRRRRRSDTESRVRTRGSRGHAAGRAERGVGRAGDPLPDRGAATGLGPSARSVGPGSAADRQLRGPHPDAEAELAPALVDGRGALPRRDRRRRLRHLPAPGAHRRRPARRDPGRVSRRRQRGLPVRNAGRVGLPGDHERGPGPDEAASSRTGPRASAISSTRAPRRSTAR